MNSLPLSHQRSPYCTSFNQAVWIFLGIEFLSYLLISDISSLLVIPFANIFSLSVGCLFILLIISFTMKNLLCFIRSHSLIFAFVSFALGDRLKKIYCYILHQRLFNLYSFRGVTWKCMVSGVTLRSLIYF